VTAKKLDYLGEVSLLLDSSDIMISVICLFT